MPGCVAIPVGPMEITVCDRCVCLLAVLGAKKQARRGREMPTLLTKRLHNEFGSACDCLAY